MVLGIIQMADAQRFGHSNYVTGWNNNIPLGYGNADLYIPNGYHYYGLQNVNGNYFVRFQHNGQYYQQPVQWQQSNGLRVATVVLNVLGSTLLNVSNGLQWGNSWNNNFYSQPQPYFYNVSPPIYYQNRRLRR